MQKIIDRYAPSFNHPYSAKDLTSIGILILLVLSILLFVTISQRQANLRSQALESISNEAESGAVTGNAIVGNDTTASNGQYVQFGN